MMALSVDQPLWLLLAIFSVLPGLRYWLCVQRHPRLALLAPAPVSRVVDGAVRALASLALLALLLGLAGLHAPVGSRPVVGKGAHVVVALDRSRSMDQAFADGERGLRHAERLRAPAKGQVAREVLREFIRSREQDLFAFVVFSTHAMPVVPLTQKRQMLYAAIDASGIGRGLGETDIGEGLLKSLALFEGREFSGSRIVLLVSDGAALMDRDTRRLVRDLLLQHRVALYWVYIRTANGPDIIADPSSQDPQAQLHRFFSRLTTPYRGYSAERPADLAQAVADISKLQNLPLNYSESVPRVSYAGVCFAVSLLCLLLLALVDAVALRAWQPER